jgi:glycosyltransferase involved in cell wall biosynthesis
MKERKKILVISFQSLTAKSGAGMARLGFFLSQKLNERNLLYKFIVHSKGKFETDFPSEPVSYLSRYYLFILNKLNKILKFQPYRFRYIQEKIFDWLCAKRIDNSISTLLVTQPYLLKTFKKAKKKGIKIIFVPANPEENYINKLVTEEKNKLNIQGTDAYTYKKRIDFYNRSMKYVDVVIGTYPTVYDSYKNSHFPGKVVQIIGHLKPDFKPVTIEGKELTRKEFKVAYIAHTVILKGLQYLLEAWENLMNEEGTENYHLHIAGNVDDSMHQYMVDHHLRTKNVHYSGHVPDVTSFLKDKDLFVVPSLVDGGPYTALEAAHYALPVIITENCGSAELLSRGNSGCWIIPIRDADSIKERIKWACHHRMEAKQVGLNAKHNLDTYKMDELITDLADYLEKKETE